MLTSTVFAYHTKEDRSESTLRGAVPLSGGAPITIVDGWDKGQRSSPTPFLFHISRPDRNYYLCAANGDEKEAWREALNSVVTGTPLRTQSGVSCVRTYTRTCTFALTLPRLLCVALLLIAL